MIELATLKDYNFNDFYKIFQVAIPFFSRIPQLNRKGTRMVKDGEDSDTDHKRLTKKNWVKCFKISKPSRL